jgi:hypothetical protein
VSRVQVPSLTPTVEALVSSLTRASTVPGALGDGNLRPVAPSLGGILAGSGGAIAPRIPLRAVRPVNRPPTTWQPSRWPSQSAPSMWIENRGRQFRVYWRNPPVLGLSARSYQRLYSRGDAE